MKECRTCKKILEDNLFSIIRTDKNTGIVYRRPDCKECRGIKHTPNKIKQVKEKTSNVIYTPVIKEDKDSLTSEEIKILRRFIKHFTISDINQDKKNRTPRTFNIDNAIMDRIKTFSDKNNMSISDSINLLLSKSLDLLKS